MKNPFVISFRKEIPDLNEEEMIDLFLINLKGTLYDKVITDYKTKIIIEGEFFSFYSGKNVPWNLWTGFSRKAELYFPEDNVIIYSVDFKYGFISWLIGILFFPLASLLFSFEIDIFLIVVLAVILFVGTLSFVTKLLLHRRLFNNTTLHRNRFKGNYNWTEIFKHKSDNELKDIVNGYTPLTIQVQEMAKEELMRRKEVEIKTQNNPQHD